MNWTYWPALGSEQYVEKIWLGFQPALFAEEETERLALLASAIQVQMREVEDPGQCRVFLYEHECRSRATTWAQPNHSRL